MAPALASKGDALYPKGGGFQRQDVCTRKSGDGTCRHCTDDDQRQLRRNTFGPATGDSLRRRRHSEPRPPAQPPSYLIGVQRRLTLAGKDRTDDLNQFLALRLTSLVLIVPTFLLLSLSSLPGLYRLLTFFFFAALLLLGPEALLNRAVSDRQERIRRDLPTLVELLMISVEAGLGFDQALARSIGSVSGPLGEEFSRFLGEVRMGADHKEALEAIDSRTDVDELRSFLMALVQAETFGVPIGPILRSQATEARIAQRQLVQEKAQKAPVKMLFPMVFCVLPALFIVVIGPAVIQVYEHIIK